MEDLGQFDLAVGRQFNGLADSIDEPAEDDLASTPATIPLEQLLQGDGFEAGLGRDLRPGQYDVDSMEEVLSDGLEAAVATLTELDEVINKHVRVRQGPFERPVRRRGELEFVVEGCGREWPKREGQVSVSVFLVLGSWSRAGGGVIHGHSKLVHPGDGARLRGRVGRCSGWLGRRWFRTLWRSVVTGLIPWWRT